MSNPLLDNMTPQERVIKDKKGILEYLENPNCGITPKGFAVVVQPHKLREVGDNGMFLGVDEENQKRMLIGQRKCRIVKIAPSAFSDSSERWAKETDLPKVGDDVIIDQYAGDWFNGKDMKPYRLLNDDEIVATVDEEE